MKKKRFHFWILFFAFSLLNISFIAEGSEEGGFKDFHQTEISADKSQPQEEETPPLEKVEFRNHFFMFRVFGGVAAGLGREIADEFSNSGKTEEEKTTYHHPSELLVSGEVAYYWAFDGWERKRENLISASILGLQYRYQMAFFSWYENKESSDPEFRFWQPFHVLGISTGTARYSEDSKHLDFFTLGFELGFPAKNLDKTYFYEKNGETLSIRFQGKPFFNFYGDWTHVFHSPSLMLGLRLSLLNSSGISVNRKIEDLDFVFQFSLISGYCF